MNPKVSASQCTLREKHKVVQIGAETHRRPQSIECSLECNHSPHLVGKKSSLCQCLLLVFSGLPRRSASASGFNFILDIVVLLTVDHAMLGSLKWLIAQVWFMRGGDGNSNTLNHVLESAGSDEGKILLGLVYQREDRALLTLVRSYGPRFVSSSRLSVWWSDASPALPPAASFPRKTVASCTPGRPARPLALRLDSSKQHQSTFVFYPHSVPDDRHP